MSWTSIFAFSLLVLPATLCLDCNINVTQGLPWSVGNISYNFASLNVETLDGIVTPNYDVSIGGDGPISSTYNWNASSANNGTSLGYWQALVEDSPVQYGVVLGKSGTDSPTVDSVVLDGQTCDVGDPVIIQPFGRTESGTQPVAARDGKLYGTDGEPLIIKGVNWFGFEEPGNSMLDGLWIGSDSITRDFATIVYRLQLLGFNAVRLPMNFKNLYELSPNGITQPCNIDTQSTIASATLDPSASANADSAPAPRAPPTRVPGTCNAYLPQDSTIDRFLAIVKYFAENQFYVVIDNHLNKDPTAVEDPEAWVDYWRRFATSIAEDSVSAPWVLLEILNEPDSQKMRWEASNGVPGAGDLTLDAMQAIYEVNPSQVLLIEGLGQTGRGLCWVRPSHSNCFRLRFQNLMIYLESLSPQTRHGLYLPHYETSMMTHDHSRVE